MQEWGRGKKVLAGLGGLFVLGAFINAAHPPTKTNVANQSKTPKNTSAQSVKPLTASPTPTPEPVTVPEPAQPAPMPPAVVPPPAPISTPQPATNCTPGYSPCIAPGSDVDCEGGSGNGPRYVAGPVYVTGSDVYDLDRDGNGIGCE